MLTVQEIVGKPENIAGVKAAFGPAIAPTICFASGGNTHAQRYKNARAAAEKVVKAPYVFTIGGGGDCPDEYKGRVLEVVYATGAYGNTDLVVTDKAIAHRLRQWPVALVCTETYTIRGYPHLIDDLGFPSREILEQAFDRVMANASNIQALWRAIAHWSVKRELELIPPPGFRDPKKVHPFGVRYPRYSAKEGKERIVTTKKLERDPKLTKEVKQLNRDANGGKLRCEGCDLLDEPDWTYDAHHLDPLANGPRNSTADNFALLCAICHRWAHYKADDKRVPVPISNLRELRAKRVS